MARTVQTVASIGNVGQYHSLAVKPDGTIGIAFIDATNNYLKLAEQSGSGWAIETVDSDGDRNYEVSLDYDSDGNPAISSVQTITYGLTVHWWNGSSWDEKSVEAGGGTLGTVTGRYSSIKFDSNDDLGVSYQDNDDDRVRYAFSSGGLFSAETVRGALGSYTSLAFDSGDQPRVLYSEGGSGGSVKLGSYNGSSWDTDIVDTGVAAMLWGSLAMNLSGQPCAAYYDTDSDLLRFAEYNGASFDKVTVDSSANVGISASLKFFDDGRALIAYVDNDNNSLKVAIRDSGNWTTQTIYDNTNVSRRCSAGIVSANSYAVSFYNSGDSDLLISLPAPLPARFPQTGIAERLFPNVTFGVAPFQRDALVLSLLQRYRGGVSPVPWHLFFGSTA